MKLVIVIEGGVVQSVFADSDAEVIVKDYDTDTEAGEDSGIDSDGNRYWAYRASVHIDKHMVDRTMKEAGEC